MSGGNRRFDVPFWEEGQGYHSFAYWGFLALCESRTVLWKGR